MMDRTRIELAVYVDLDPTPGTFYSAESARHGVASVLEGSIGHYNPVVSITSRDVRRGSVEDPEEQKAPEFLDQKQAINYLAYKEAAERLGPNGDIYQIRREARMISETIKGRF